MQEQQPQPEASVPGQPSGAAPAQQRHAEPIELCLYFAPREVQQMEYDALVLVRRGLLPPDADRDRAQHLEGFIRFACLDHTHQAVQKMLSAEVQVAGQLRGSLKEVEGLRRGYQEKTRQLEQKLAEADRSLAVASRLAAKYVRILQDQGLLEEGEKEDG